MVVAQAGDQRPARREGPVDFTEQRLVFNGGITLGGAEQAIVEQQAVMEIVAAVPIVGANETLHGVAVVNQAQLLAEQVTVLLAQHHLVGIG
ncbi:hypothetical protein D9M71_423910 [compost metagenome]